MVRILVHLCRGERQKRVTELHLHFEKAPKGKVPFIEYQEKLIGDSTLILEMFEEKEGIDLDRGLTASDRAISLAFRRMLKENDYWGIVYLRYSVPENWEIYRKIIATIIYPEVPPSEWEPKVEEFGEKIRNQMYGHGLSRHSSSEICQIINADFQALSDFLADKPFFMGERPTTLDATAYASIGNVIKPPFKSPIVDYVAKLDNLCQYYERMKKEFFSEI
ncbi:MAG: glutathione S-transferase family protein [Prochloraceae cyanobacterium]|nr:glutathione S-transferase family protein [Prochloraceae cyanobacterium]